MCGLVALFSTKPNGFSSEEGRIFEESMIFNQLRGDDSTGAVCVTNKDSWLYLKSLGGYKQFTRHSGFADFRRSVMNDGRLVFGHGRAATRGTVTIDNAHPFHIKKNAKELIFIHNGTLENSQPFPGFWTYSVDSEFLGTMIAEHGAEKALSEVNGAIACMWWDVNEKTFNFYHNKDRPLVYMRTKTGEFYLNSERWILEYINWKYKFGVPDKEIYTIEEQAWHKVPVNGDMTGHYDITKIKRVHRAITHHGWRGMYVDDDDDDQVYVTRPAYPHSCTTPMIPPPEEKEFWDRMVDVIEWIDGKKITTYRDKHVMTEKEDPPEANLIRMYELRNSGDVMKVFRGNAEGDRPVYVTTKYEHFVADKRRRLAEEKNARSQERVKETPNATILRFTTRHPVKKNKVKHYGEVLKGADKPHLQLYRNNNDGEVFLGKTVNVELMYCEEKVLRANNNHLTKVVCAEIKPQQDCYIDYVFYTEMTKKEVEETRVFRGVVGSITLMSSEEQHVSGAIAMCSLYNISELDEEPANAAIVKAAETVH